MFSPRFRQLFASILAAGFAAGCASDEEKPFDDLTEFEPYDPRERLQQVYELGSENVESLIESTPELVIIDVRKVELFDESRLPNAAHYDYKSGAFEAEIGALEKDVPVLIYGTAETPEPSLASTDLRDLGFLTVYLLTDGIEGWIAAGKPHETGLK